MVWSWGWASGVGNLVKIDGIINAEADRQILIHLKIPSDSDPQHTTNVVSQYQPICLEEHTTEHHGDGSA